MKLLLYLMDCNFCKLNDEPIFKINDELLKECRIYSMEKTGYATVLKIKPFESILELPQNIEINDDDDLTSLIDKYEFGLNTFAESLKSDIDDCFLLMILMLLYV
jgi:hypothetical protein